MPSLDIVIYKLGGKDGQYDPALTGLPTSGWQVRELGIAVTGMTSYGTTNVGSASHISDIAVPAARAASSPVMA